MMNLNLYQRRVAWNTINLAKKQLDSESCDSINLANYILRDLDATKEAELSDLSWAMHRDSSLHRNDVLFLIELLEKHLLSYDKKGGDAQDNNLATNHK